MICHPGLTGSLDPAVRWQLAPFVLQIGVAARFFLSVIPAVKGDFSKRGYQGARTGCFFDLISTLRLYHFIDASSACSNIADNTSQCHVGQGSLTRY